jgi:hypothetical protein
MQPSDIERGVVAYIPAEKNWLIPPRSMKTPVARLTMRLLETIGQRSIQRTSSCIAHCGDEWNCQVLLTGSFISIWLCRTIRGIDVGTRAEMDLSLMVWELGVTREGRDVRTRCRRNPLRWRRKFIVGGEAVNGLATRCCMRDSRQTLGQQYL